MNSNLLYILSNSFRFILIAITCHGVSILVQSAILEKKHSRKYLILYYLLKIVLINTLLGIVLKELYKDVYMSNEWLRILYTVCMLSAAVLTYMVLIYTFKGEFIWVAVVAWCGELVTVFLGYFSVGIINTLEGRVFFTHIGTFHVWDLGIPIICYSMWAIIYHCCRPMLYRIRNYKLRHKRILWVLFVCYTTAMTFPSFMEHRAGVRISILVLFLSAAVVFILLFLTLKRYRKKLDKEHDFMDAQQKLMKAHYQNLIKEIKRIEICGREMEIQVEKLSAMNNSSTSQRVISEYRENLIHEHQKLQAGMYCDDWMLDAALTSQAELLDKYGIQFNCSLQEYQNKTLSRQDLLQLILNLIHWGIRANTGLENQKKWIELQISAVKNQLILQFDSSWDGNERVSKNILKRNIQKYDGSIRIEKHMDDVRITVIL